MTERVVKIGSMVKGVNNRLEPTELQTIMPDRSRGTYLHGADNVDINDKRRVRRREGQTLIDDGDFHSLWAEGDDAFVVKGGTLYRLTENADAVSMTEIRTGLANTPVSYSVGADDDVYWSNGAELRRVSGVQDKPASTPPLSLIPAAVPIAGALPAGKYLLAFTSVQDARESSASPVVQLDLPENSGVRIVTAETVEVYMSGPNGDVLTLQRSGATGTIDVLTYDEGGRRCMTLNTAPTPAGSIVRHYNAAMVVAVGSLLCVSLPYNYGVFNPSIGYIPFPADITMIEPTTKGLFIAADKTYWITDLFTQGDLNEVLPYGAIPGTSGKSPDDNSVFWQSPRGLIIGDDSGKVAAVQEEALALSGGVFGATLFRERNGSKHLVSTRKGAQQSVAGATTYMEAEVIRKGTVL